MKISFLNIILQQKFCDEQHLLVNCTVYGTLNTWNLLFVRTPNILQKSFLVNIQRQLLRSLPLQCTCRAHSLPPWYIPALPRSLLYIPYSEKFLNGANFRMFQTHPILPDYFSYGNFSFITVVTYHCLDGERSMHHESKKFELAQCVPQGVWLERPGKSENYNFEILF